MEIWRHYSLSDKCMKILLINYEFPPLGGGAGNATKYIAKELAALGNEVRVLTAWFPGENERELVDGYIVHRVKCLREKKDRSSMKEMLSFVREAIRFVPSLFQEFTPEKTISFFALPTGVVAHYIKRKYRTPYVLSLRGGDVPGFLLKDLWLHHVVTLPFTWIIWKASESIVANSKSLQVLSQKTGNTVAHRVEYIPNGVDTTVYFPDVSKRNKNILKILFVGRLTRQKGVIYILEAGKVLLNKYSNLRGKFSVDIAGDGPLRAELEDFVKKNSLTDIVTSSGWISKKDLPTRYQESDLFVFPSFEEGMPNVLLEAIAAGLPSIVSNIGGNDELVFQRRNGFLFEKTDDIAEYIYQLLSDESLRENMGKEAAQIAKTMSWSLVAKAYLELLQKNGQ